MLKKTFKISNNTLHKINILQCDTLLAFLNKLNVEISRKDPRANIEQFLNTNISGLSFIKGN